MKQMLLCFLFLTISFDNLSQHIGETFTDQELKPDSYVRCTAQEDSFVYIGGNTTQACGPSPFISKIE